MYSYTLTLCIHTILIIQYILVLSVHTRGVVGNISRGGGLNNFFLFRGAQLPLLGPENSLKSKDFTGPGGGGLAPIGSPLTKSLVHTNLINNVYLYSVHTLTLLTMYSVHTLTLKQCILVLSAHTNLINNVYLYSVHTLTLLTMYTCTQCTH